MKAKDIILMLEALPDENTEIDKIEGGIIWIKEKKDD